jgi:hypothetical protein
MKLWTLITGWIPTPYLIIAGIVIAIAMLSGATWCGWKLRDYQAAEERLEQAKTANQALAAKVQEVADLSSKLRKTQQEATDDRLKAAWEKERDLKNVTEQKDRVIHSLRLGLIRLRDPGTRPTERAGGAVTSSITGVTPVVQSERGAELSDELSEFLVGEASRADEKVVELNACKVDIRIQTEKCNQLLRESFAVPNKR